MKKKLIFLYIAALCVLLVGCTAFAACDPKDPAESGFKVTLDFNSEQGDVTLSKPAEGELYDAGEKVTVTVTPKDGWLLDAFTVSGFDDAALNGGGYTFDIQADTTVNVTFKKATFSVSLTSAPSDGGTAELSPKKDIYEYGDEVTLTMTPTGDNVARLTVNDQNIELTENEYKFTVKENMTIAVKFVDRPTAVLESLQGSITFEGTRDLHYSEEYSEYYDDVSGTFKAIFDSEQKASYLELIEEFEPLRGWLFKATPENTYQQFYHNQDGTVYAEDFDDPFESVFNPFNILTTAAITKVEDGKWAIEDADTMNTVANTLFGLIYRPSSFAIFEENGYASKIEVIVPYYEGMADYIYEGEIKDRGTASIDENLFKDYVATDAHNALKKVLHSADDAENYTVKYESSDQNYTLYYTSDGIYIDENGNARGYVPRRDGKVWAYNYDTEQQTYDFDHIVNDDIKALKAVFTLEDNNGEYYNWLKVMGDGKFEVHTLDAFDSDGSLPSFFAYQMATGEDQISLFGYAQSFSLTLDNDKLSTVEFNIVEKDEYYGDIIASYHVKLTFSDWDTTTLPITIPQATLDGKINPAYGGTWATEDGKTFLFIDLDKILFDDEGVSNLTTLQEGGYSFSYEGQNYSIVKSGDNLSLTEGTNSYTLYNCPWYMFIGTFLGTKQVGESGSEDVDVIITPKEVQIKFGTNQPKTATDLKFGLVYVEDDGYIMATYQFDFSLKNDYGQDEQYVLQQVEEGFDVLGLAYAGTSDGAYVYRDKYEALDSWEEYVGTYSGEGYKAELTSDNLTITHNDQSESATDILFYRDWSYSYPEGYYYQFTFHYSGKDCAIEFMDNALILVIFEDKATLKYSSYYLMDESYKYDASPYYGVYEGQNYSSEQPVLYHVDVNQNGVTLKIGEKDHNASIVYFSLKSSYEGYGGYFILRLEDGSLYFLTVWPSSTMLQDENDFYIFLYTVTDEAE